MFTAYRRQNNSHQRSGLSETNRSNIRHNKSHKKIGVSDTNKQNVNNGRCSLPDSIPNSLEGGCTVSDITPSPRIEDMVPLKDFKLMEAQKKECERELEKIKLSSLNKMKHGRNSLKREMWTPTDFSNEKKIMMFCSEIYRHIKAFPDGWMRYNPKNQRSVSARAMENLTVPKHNDNNDYEMEREYYWNNMVMPVMNKKYGDMRSSDTERLWKQFKSK